MRDVGFAKFNDKLEGKHEPVNWSNVVKPTTNPVSADVKLFVESAVEFMMAKGEVTTGKISAQEPQWAVNFKKALGAALKIKLPFQQAQSIPYFWAAMEQGIEGVWENTFQVTELPEYLIYEARNVETRILSRKEILSVENVVPDKVGPDSSHNKTVYQLTPQKNSNRDPRGPNLLESAQHTLNVVSQSVANYRKKESIREVNQISNFSSEWKEPLELVLSDLSMHGRLDERSRDDKAKIKDKCNNLCDLSVER